MGRVGTARAGFFFSSRRRHTRWNCDWSSDVCSSDLATAGTGAATETEFSSAAQRERRQRILDATLALASRGGYDAVQMRAVADRAGVALGTLYRYFPPKIHLLVSGLAREFERNQEKLDRIAIPGDTPYD